jgi:hypothetical protein
VFPRLLFDLGRRFAIAMKVEHNVRARLGEEFHGRGANAPRSSGYQCRFARQRDHVSPKNKPEKG